MKIKYYLLMTLVFAMTFNACKSDDDDGLTVIPPEDRAEQQVKDKDSLLGYLNSHYYNSGDIADIISPTLDDLVITELLDGASVPVDHTLLINDVEVKTSVFEDEDNNVTYEYYILKINQGGGEDAPKFCDDVRVSYSGSFLDEEVFDSSVIPVDFNLLSLVVGWSRVLPEFNAAESFVENGDGTVSFLNSGVGVMFIPSGLGYFDAGPAGIAPYANLIFKFELYQSMLSDHDSDGIPSYLEDLNNDKNYSSDDDTDDNGLQDFLDPDDDGDGIFTINELEPKEYTVDTNQGEQEPVLGAKEFELSRSEDAGVITINTVTIKDSDNNGIDDYLDENITINYNEEG